MSKVFQVVEEYYFYEEKQETSFGFYSNYEKAVERKGHLLANERLDPCHLFVREIELDTNDTRSYVTSNV